MSSRPDNRSALPSPDRERPLLPERYTFDAGHAHYAREYLRAVSDLILSGARFRFENADRGTDTDGETRIASVTVYVDAAKLRDAHLEVRRRMLAGDEDYVIRMPQPPPPRNYRKRR